MPDHRVLEDLEAVWLFAGCTRAELRRMAKVFQEVDVPPGTLLVEEGEPGLLFFVVVAGRASVTRGTRAVACLGPGDSFGELSLLDDRPRSASVTSDTDMTLLVIRQHQFQKVLRDTPSMARRLMTTLAGRIRNSERLATH